jgi:prepilin-type N-terminal cleavage/methylation domain-containing protein
MPQWDDLPKLSYVTQVIQETMRLYPTGYTLARQCVREDSIAGYKIPKSATILISVYGIHRDPGWGRDPKEFRPERFAQKATVPRAAYMPFATGKHICVGNGFTMTEMITTLAILGQRYQLIRADHEPVKAKAQIGLIPAREIPVHLEVRNERLGAGELLGALRRLAQRVRISHRLCDYGAAAALHVSAGWLARVGRAGDRIREALFPSLQSSTMRTDRRDCAPHPRPAHRDESLGANSCGAPL